MQSMCERVCRRVCSPLTLKTGCCCRRVAEGKTLSAMCLYEKLIASTRIGNQGSASSPLNKSQPPIPPSAQSHTLLVIPTPPTRPTCCAFPGWIAGLGRGSRLLLQRRQVRRPLRRRRRRGGRRRRRKDGRRRRRCDMEAHFHIFSV
jgi:hypothetical protein